MKKILLITLSTLLLLACTKKSATTELLPTPTGSLTGRVHLYNSDAVLVQNASGATVSLDSTSISATTDSLGTYTLTNVPQGIYTITYSKDGYTTHKIVDYTINGGSSAEIVSYVLLYAPSSVEISNFAARLDSPNVVIVSATINPSNSDSAVSSNVQVFISTSPSVSSVNYMYSYTLEIGTTNNSFLEGTLPEQNFPSGSVLYYIAYPLYNNAPSYVSPATGHTVYEGLGAASSIVSVTLP